MFRLDHGYSFGIKKDISNPVEYLDDQECVYICGHQLVKLDVDSKTQQVVQCSPDARRVTALAVSQTRRVTAFAESFEGRLPSITIIDWTVRGKRQRRVLSDVDVGSNEIMSMQFAVDTKYMVIQGGEPSWGLTYLLWEKPKVAAQYKNVGSQSSQVNQADSHSFDSSVALVTGNGFLRMFRLAEDVLKPLAMNIKQEPRNFLCHAWLPEERIVVGTDTGELFIFEGTEFRKILDTSPHDGHPIDSLLSFSKGFVAGCDGGRVRIYEKSEDARLFYKLTAEFAVVGDESRVIHMTVSANEENLVALLSSGQAYEFRLSNYELFKSDDIVFRPLVTSFHTEGSNGEKDVTGLDICLRKPLFVSSGADRTVRLWNFSQTKSSSGQISQPTLELVKRFREPAYCVAFHPSGMHAVVGFESTLQLMNVLMDDIRPVRDFAMRRVSAARFSHGGQYFAAATGTTITVFETYTGIALRTMRGHHDKVTCISWSSDDTVIVSCGADGVIHRWDTLKGSSENRVDVPRNSLLSVDAEHVGEQYGSEALVVGRSAQEDVSHCFRHVDCIGRSSKKTDVNTEGLFFNTVVALSNDRGVIVGTGTEERMGSIRLYSAPLSDYTSAGATTERNLTSSRANRAELTSAGAAAQATVPYTEWVCHGAPVTKLVMSWDEGLVISGAKDGTIILHYPTDAKASRKTSFTPGHSAISQDNAVAHTGPSAISLPIGAGLPFAEEILVTKAALEGSRARKKRLENTVAELKVQNDYNLEYKKMSQEEKMKEVEEKFQEELAEEKRKHEELHNAKQEAESKYDAELQQMHDQHGKDLEELEESYKKKIQAEIHRYDTLCFEHEQRTKEWEEEIQEMLKQQDEHIRQLEEDYKRAIEEENEATERLAEERKKLKDDITSRQDNLEEDADSQMDEMKARYEKRLAKEKQATLMLMGENGMMKRKYDSLEEDKKAQRTKIQEMLDREKELYDQISSLQKDVQGHKKEIREREETIAEKDQRIFDLHKKNQELEKFKFVLNYKIQELKRQIRPRKREIADMREQMKEMELELLQYHKSNAALLLMISELKLKRQGMQSDHDQVKQEVERERQHLDGVERDLLTIYRNVDSPNVLKEEVTELFHKYVHEDPTAFQTGKKAAMDTEDLQKEYARQRAYLERSLQGVEKKLDKESGTLQKDRQRLMRENTMLTKEINGLRRRIQTLKIESKGQGLQEDVDTAKPKTPMERSGLGRTMARYGVFGEGLPPSSRNQSRKSRQTASSGAARKLTINTGAANDIEKQQETIAGLMKRLYELRELVMAEPGMGNEKLQSPYVKEEELRYYQEKLNTKTMDEMSCNDDHTEPSTNEGKETLPPIKSKGHSQIQG